MDFAETIRGIFGGQSSQPPPSGDDYAAPLRPMVDPAARTRAVGGSPEFQGKVDETLRDALRETAEPFKQVGRAISGRSDNPVPEGLTGGLGVATAIPGGLARGALKAGAKLGGEALEDIIAPAAKKAATGGVADMIKAYHGSPHDFDRFDLSKIGTGEGAQAYGHGLYFAENEGVAKGYRDALSPQAYIVKEPDGTHTVEFAGGGRHQTGEQMTGLTRQEADQRLADLNSSRGRMYQVGIRANPEHFLDWDKPLSEQHPKVRGILKGKVSESETMAEAIGRAHRNPMFAGDILGKDRATPEELTRGLAEAGIPGIKYLDQGSRISSEAQKIVDNYGSRDKAMEIAQKRLEAANKSFGAGSDRKYWESIVGELKKSDSRNYVVFDDKLIDILKKYGIAGIGALPAMNAFHYQDKQ